MDQEKMQTANRMMNAISKIPAQKQPRFTSMMECLLLGADMAQMETEHKPPLQDTSQNETRPSA